MSKPAPYAWRGEWVPDLAYAPGDVTYTTHPDYSATAWVARSAGATEPPGEGAGWYKLGKVVRSRNHVGPPDQWYMRLIVRVGLIGERGYDLRVRVRADPPPPRKKQP